MISVRADFGENLLSEEKGERLRALLLHELRAGKDVLLDFSGVRVVASSFLNAAIGRLYGDLPESTIRQHLQVREMSVAGKQTLRSVIENAKRYFSEPKYRDAIDSATSALLEA